MKERLEPVLIFIASTFYYSLLSAFRYTWLFGSGDSGDWLASAKMWFVPQPYGSPLYISAAKLVGLLPGSIEWNMTFWLSIIPASLSIVLIYLAVKTLTNSIGLARISALIMLGALVMTTQAIVVEEYGFVLMFFSAALYAYSSKRHNWAVVLFGLASAVHVLVIPMVLMFLAAHYRSWGYWIKKAPLFIVTGIMPYGLIFFMMYANTPKWIAGDLTIDSLLYYISTTSTIGRISIFDAPERLFLVACFMLVTFGLAIKPALRLIKKDKTNPFFNSLFLVTCFSIWLYATNVDYTTYTFIFYAIPCVAILAAIGLHRGYGSKKAVALVAVMMIVVNGLVYDVERIDNQNPIATTLYQEVMNMPDGSYIVTSKGGYYTFGVMYAISQGKDVKILYLADERGEINHSYNVWLEWTHRTYNVTGDVEEIIKTADTVYVAKIIDTSRLKGEYQFEEYSQSFERVVVVTP